MVEDGAFSDKIDYVTICQEIINLEGHPYCNHGSKVTAIGWILPIGEVSSGSVCTYSLRSKLVPSYPDLLLPFVQWVAHFSTQGVKISYELFLARNKQTAGYI